MRILFITILLTLPTLLFSQTFGSDCREGTLCNPLKFKTIQSLIAAILDLVVLIGVPIATFFIIYAGFLFVTARGSEEKLKSAKSTFLWAVVGTVILLGASLLAKVLESTVSQLKV